jgi:hypothetical protein
MLDERWHGVPTLEDLPTCVKPAPLPGVRVGDAMRLMDDLDIAMEIAGAAIRLAADAGARTESLDVLRTLYSKLQNTVGQRRAEVPA